MSKVLVTGGCGFIGSHLVGALLDCGHEVVVVDNLSTGKLENIEHVIGAVEFHQDDIRDLDILRRVTRGADYVFHEAALGSVPRSVADPLTTNAVNVTGTLNVLVAAREAEAKRVVFASSSSVYGDTPTLPKVETMRPMPVSPYAVSKLAGETYMQAFFHSYGLETISLRYFNVFGPRQDPESQYAAVIPRFVAALLDGDRPIIYGDGTQSRDFTYVQNVVEANLMAMEVSQTRGPAVNIACGESTTLNELLEALVEVSGLHAEPVYADFRPGDVKHSLADYSAASDLLGYCPTTCLLEGLRLTSEWFAGKRSRETTYRFAERPRAYWRESAVTQRDVHH